MNASKTRHMDVEIIRLYDTGLSAYQIAEALGLGHSTVDYRLNVNAVVKRSISESLVGRPKGEGHRRSLSMVRILTGVAKGERNPNWKGGITSEYERMRKSKEYELWRIAVFTRDNFTCQDCDDKTGGNLEAHYIKSFADYPELRVAIDNGVTLCEKCHSKRTYLKSRELLETPTVKTGTISSRALSEGRFNDYVRDPKGKI